MKKIKKQKGKSEEQAAPPEFAFKEFTPEEDQIYHDAVQNMREAIDAGKPLQEAYEAAPVADKELEAIIQADFLKIMIAEMHFGKGISIDDLAKKLSVSTTLIQDTIKRMLQEAGSTAAAQFGQEFGSIAPETDD